MSTGESTGVSAGIHAPRTQVMRGALGIFGAFGLISLSVNSWLVATQNLKEVYARATQGHALPKCCLGLRTGWDQLQFHFVFPPIQVSTYSRAPVDVKLVINPI